MTSSFSSMTSLVEIRVLVISLKKTALQIIVSRVFFRRSLQLQHQTQSALFFLIFNCCFILAVIFLAPIFGPQPKIPRSALMNIFVLAANIHLQLEEIASDGRAHKLSTVKLNLCCSKVVISLSHTLAVSRGGGSFNPFPPPSAWGT